MIIKIEKNQVTVKREATDPKFYSESFLLHTLKKKLNMMGYDLIKKLMWKDGHLVSDTQHYLRSRKIKKGQEYLMIWDVNYQIRKLTEPWNEKGEFWLQIERGIGE